jgi:hypothetical protein
MMHSGLSTHLLAGLQIILVLMKDFEMNLAWAATSVDPELIYWENQWGYPGLNKPDHVYVSRMALTGPVWGLAPVGGRKIYGRGVGG